MIIPKSYDKKLDFRTVFLFNWNIDEEQSEHKGRIRSYPEKSFAKGIQSFEVSKCVSEHNLPHRFWREYDFVSL